MLILTRKIGEKVMIGDEVNIAVLAVKGNHVRLGITAPVTTKVHREEIYNRIKREQSDKLPSAHVCVDGDSRTA